jgi:hypothetical protein
VAGYMFAATSSGIDHFDLFNPALPFKTGQSMPTSSPVITSLAANRTTLFATDNDSTVELFTLTIPSLPQHTGTLDTGIRAANVHVTNELIFVADPFGQTTKLFFPGGAAAGQLPFGSNAFAAALGGARFIAGPNRTLRAIDATTPSVPLELFEYQLPVTDGTDNAIHAMARSGNTLYVAAGDNGLVVLDVTGFEAPYPLVHYVGTGTTSVFTSGSRSWFTDATGRVTEAAVDSTGIALADSRSWDTMGGAVLRDMRAETLLLTAGARAQLWTLGGASPTLIGDITFGKEVVDAVIGEGTILAALVDGTVWIGRNAQSPTQVPLANVVVLERHENAVLAAEVRESEGKTLLHYYATGDLAAPETRAVTVNGAPVGNIAMDATRAGIFTFNGISIVTLGTGDVRTIAGSNTFIPRALAFSGQDLLVADATRLRLYALAQTLAEETLLPAELRGLGVSNGVAVFATAEGRGVSQPADELPRPTVSVTNSYYRKAVAAGDRLYLFDDQGVDVFSTLTGAAPDFITNVRPGGLVDLTATDDLLFTLAGNGELTSWTTSGKMAGRVSLSQEPSDEPLALFAVRSAVWLSMSSGCSTGTCVRKTLVVDPTSLAVTATLPGGVRDVVVSGMRAYALFELPSEVRVYDVTDALHPSPVLAASRPASARSVAFDGANVLLLGDKVYSFSAATLAPNGERLSGSTVSDALKLRVDDGCAIVAGRGESASFFALPGWTETGTTASPSPVRSFALANGRLILLTGHSLEVWADRELPSPGKRRGVR